MHQRTLQSPRKDKFIRLTSSELQNWFDVSNIPDRKQNLKKYGAVSSQICKDMIENLFKISKTDICISTTGIAGPSGGSKLKPVGLVYIGIKFKKNYKIYMYNFNKKLERNKIQKKTVNIIFNILDKMI